MKPVSVLSHGIPAGAEEEWERLVLAARRTVVPCAGPASGHWHGEDMQQRLAAVACLDCPLMLACDAYAVAAGERWGVWGGKTEKERRAKERT